ncbi:MAG: phosphatidate cytidylyltransferase [Bacteroidales bacterium]|nr:phosphatidate cytidylyltransferase [Bacteroidales bacterium]
MKNLLTRTITGLIFIALVIASFFAPAWYAVLLFFFFAMVGVHEYLKMIQKKASPSYGLTMGLSAMAYAILAVPTLCDFGDTRLSWILILSALFFIVSLVVFAQELYRKKTEPMLNIGATLLPVFWIALPLASVVFFSHFMNAAMMVLALFILIWAYDTFAYCGGTLFGKHPLFKRVSPKKSWEGVIISFVLTSLSAFFFNRIPLFETVGMTSVQWVVFSWIVIVTSTYGDLTESLFKRNCGVKDSGKILPGHGGVLDRFDSLFFSAPAAFIFWFFATQYLNL